MTTTYFPLDIEPRFACTQSSLERLEYRPADEGNTVEAYFSIPEALHSLLKIRFEHVDFLRVLDELWLSTEEGKDARGILPYHFAYRVEGSLFEHSQSKLYNEIQSGAVHYRFITGANCLDVISTTAPCFDVVRSMATATGRARPRKD